MRSPNKDWLFSLRLILPTALVLIPLLIGWFTYLNYRQFHWKNTEQQARLNIVQDANQLQAAISELIRLNQLDRVQDLVVIYSSDVNVTFIVLSDEMGSIIASGKREYIGKDFLKSLPKSLSSSEIFSRPSLQKISHTMTGRSELMEADDHIVGVYPVVLGSTEGARRPDRVGFLTMGESLAQARQTALEGATQQGVQFGSLLLSMAILFGLLMNRFITARLRKIASAANEFEAGNLDTRSGLNGRDEIGRLSQAFDSMVSERARQENRIHKNEQILEQRVAERTRELEAKGEELLRAEKLSSLGRLAGGVAHELRTPLSVISNSIYYLQHALKQPDADTAEALGEASRAVDNSQHIITELLDYARTPSSQENLSSVPIDAVIDQVLHDLPIPDSIEIKRFGHSPAPLKANRGQIERILGNLIMNAIQAMDDHGELTISQHRANQKLEIKVTDTGTGIDPEKLESIFEPLASGKTTGIGLGLAISREYALLNNGSLTAANDEQTGGATFTLTLPIT